jgi:hypothetical protein
MRILFITFHKCGQSDKHDEDQFSYGCNLCGKMSRGSEMSGETDDDPFFVTCGKTRKSMHKQRLPSFFLTKNSAGAPYEERDGLMNLMVGFWSRNVTKNNEFDL